MLTYETYTPTPKQLEAHLSPITYKLYGGSMGSGKSYWLAAEVIRLSVLFPGNTILFTRKTLRDLKRTSLPILLEMIPDKIIRTHNKSEGHIVLTNGSEIYYSDLEKADKHKSLNLGVFAIDEASEVEEDIFMMLQTRLRKNIPGIRYFGLLASNPEPGWLKERFVEKSVPDHKFFQALPKDNPHLPKDYIDNLRRDLPPILRSKYIEGSWDVFDEQIFRADWVVPSDTLPERYDFKVIAIDPAITEKDLTDKHNDPDESAIVVLGVDGSTNIIHELETVHGCFSFSTLIDNIKAAIKRHKPDMVGVESVAFQKAIADTLSRQGIPITELKADVDKVRRAITVTHFFEQNRVRINNHKLQKQLMEFPKGKHDDLVDALVYALRIVRDNSIESYMTEEQRVRKAKLNQLDPNSKQFWENHLKEIDKKPESEITSFFSKMGI